MRPWMVSGGTALALLFATGAVRADVTPENVWTAWKAMVESAGETVTTASESRQGDTLVVKGIALSMDQPPAKVSGTLDEMRLKDRGDGTVGITYSDSLAMNVDTAPVNGQPAAHMALDVKMPGMSTIVSGTPDALKFAVDAPSMVLHLDGGATTGAEKGSLTVDATLKGTTGTYALAPASSGHAIDYKIASKLVEFSSHVVDPMQKTDVNLQMTLADLAANSSGVYLGAQDMAKLTAALDAGFKLNSDVTYGAGTYAVDSVQGGMPVKVSGTIGSGEFGLALDKSHFQLVSGSKAVTLTVDSKAIPIKGLGGSFGEFAFNMMMPLEKSGTPQSFDLLMKLVDLQVADSIWGMIDPTGALPHDPATLVIDTKGTATLTANLTDQGGLEAMGGKPPGQLNSFDINAIDLKVAGAEVTGGGGLTFDNSDMTSFNGVPAPTGKLTFKATGLTGLIDKLVAMGAVPQDQAMQGKMMLGMFTTPGVGPDTLVSTLEFDGKTMSINGMQMPLH